MTGDVQGVGFRWAAQGEAERLGVVGRVRNRTDGAVEVVAQGDRSALDAFQGDAGLDRTGEPDAATLTALGLQSSAQQG